MMLWPLLALIPVFCLGRWCVTQQDTGCGVVLCAAAGYLMADGLHHLPTYSAPGTVLFLLVLSGMLLHTEETPVFAPWRQYWNETLNILHPSAALLALFCGMTGRFLPLLPLAAVLGLLTHLADTSAQRTAGLLLPLFGMTLLGAVLSHWVPLRGASLVCSAACLCIACLHLIPLAETFLSRRAVQALFCLFVFLSYYFTNCII